MSLVGHRFGRVEFRIFVTYCFLQAGAVEKFETNIRNSTCLNNFFHYLVVRFVQVLLVEKCQDIAYLEIQSTQHPGWNQQERI